ncbi:MAG: bifunctional diaminohydroxyphosphoribosylaminopyrimidine deaminase/5-amino-6-(5-phosphoribosylamino)uracil reductase RibD [Alteromonadaceae bacterium]|nr:bifunctional diaminohydroxyphosphoribosylaminopyrimidine deaminase/5-amino-6-(5-phosphoribosylamino)uracil reductase RibD [Alteromonadaceae bacterium]
MQRAIELAKRGKYTTSPNPRVGCVLVKNGRIIGEGFHAKAGSGHAEVNALLDVSNRAENTEVKDSKKLTVGATAYVTLEPCSHYGRTPPCAQGLIDAGISHVIAAMVDPNPQVSGRGMSLLEKGGIGTQVGLLENEAKALNAGFIKLMTKGIPFVRCKMAASLDGKTAMANGESQWITSAAARRDVQRYRAQSCAVITGADSILIDNAKMTVRWSELGYAKKQYPEDDIRQPVRVVIDSQNRLTPDLAFFGQHSKIILVRSTLENIPAWPHFVEQVQIPLVLNAKDSGLNNRDGKIKPTGKIDLLLLLKALAKRGLNDVLIESGARLAGAFIEQDLVDELILYQAPKLMGGDAKSLLTMANIQSLSSAKNLRIKDLRMVGPDIRIVAGLKAE